LKRRLLSFTGMSAQLKPPVHYSLRSFHIFPSSCPFSSTLPPPSPTFPFFFGGLMFPPRLGVFQFTRAYPRPLSFVLPTPPFSLRRRLLFFFPPHYIPFCPSSPGSGDFSPGRILSVGDFLALLPFFDVFFWMKSHPVVTPVPRFPAGLFRWLMALFVFLFSLPLSCDPF